MPTKITRRDFVSTTTAAGVALGAAPAFGQAPAVSTGASTRSSSPRATATSTRTAAPKTGVAEGVQDDDQRRQTCSMR